MADVAASERRWLWPLALFAVSTVALWIAVIIQALRHFPSPPRPNEHSRWHQTVGKLAAYDMTLTAITGWLFYWLAFVAS